MKLLLVILILSVAFIAGCTQTPTKAKFYCDEKNFTVCFSLIDNCTDSIIIEENSAAESVSYNITNKNDTCSIFFNVTRMNVQELVGTSMICDVPIVNGKLTQGFGFEYCHGSYVDKIKKNPPVESSGGLGGSSSRGFSVLAVAMPWSLSPSGAFTLTINNGVGQDISITKLYAWSSTENSKSGIATLASPEKILTDEKKTITFPAINQLSGATGNEYTYSIAVEYILSGSAFNSTGTLSSTYS